MLKINFLLGIFSIVLLNISAGLSFNRPKFDRNAKWESNAISFASNGTVGSDPHNIFIDIHNTIYITVRDLNLVQIWSEESSNATSILSGSLSSPTVLFVTINGDIYINNEGLSQIDKWTLNSTDGIPLINVLWTCLGIFIDTNDTIYCSNDEDHIVMSTSMDDGSNMSTIVAGINGSLGSTADMLYKPNGIFVDENFILYVADWGNDRIQKFLPGELNATTIAGNGALGTITLHGPIALTLDADGYLFILEWYAGRLVGSGPDGFRCIVGCSGAPGSTSNQLLYPRIFSFDSFGNIYVADTDNHRIQKFILTNNTDESLTTSEQTLITSEFGSISTDIVQTTTPFIDTTEAITLTDIVQTITLSTDITQITTSMDIEQTTAPLTDTTEAITSTDIVQTTTLSTDVTQITTSIDIEQTTAPFTYTTETTTLFIDIAETITSTNIVQTTTPFIDTTQTTTSTDMVPVTTVFVDTTQTTTSTDIVPATTAFVDTTQITTSTIAIQTTTSTDTTQTTALLTNQLVIQPAASLSARLFSGVSFNRPNFDRNATWNPNATTFTDNSTVGLDPSSIFIDLYNTIYVSVRGRNVIQVWNEGNINSIQTISLNISSPNDIFVLNNGDIYASNRYDGMINKWRLDSPDSENVTMASGPCISIFIDINNYLYCSLSDYNKVVKTSLNDNSQTWFIVAGNGLANMTSDTLNRPAGIFVDENFNLYVADWSNNRIQKFQSGQLNGSTIIGNGSLDTITLYGPMDVHLDGNGFVFIVDWGNHRIIGSNLDGFHCIAGCSNDAGSTASTLFYPVHLAFDRCGNIYVIDGFNQRIQQFILQTNSCQILNINLVTSTHSNQITSLPQISTTTQDSTRCPDCMSPIITLIPNDTSLINPIEFHRSEDISINSIINLHCIQSLSIITKWLIINSTFESSNSQLFIPSKILSYGLYEFKLIITKNVSSRFTSTKSIFVKIIQSDIVSRLIEFSNSLITNSYEKDLILNPGLYSIDPDANIFNRTNWYYTYYYQIDNSMTLINTSESSLTIPAGFLSANKTYRFIVNMTNRQNPNIQANNSLFVQISDRNIPMIGIDCLISSMCLYEYINPSQQFSIYSFCIDNCTKIDYIQWKIYQGIENSSTNLVEWNEIFLSILGINTNNLTVLIESLNILHWKFQVIYSFNSTSSISETNFILNLPPRNGTCSINSLNGTTSTPFIISCINWFDENGIQDYSISINSSQMLIATSIQSTIEVRLPAGDQINILIDIRDKFNAITQYQIQSIQVIPDWIAINTFINDIEQLNNEIINNNPIIELLASQNENIIGQIINLISQIFNQLNNQKLEYVVTNALPATSISITPLNNIEFLKKSSTFLNTSTLVEYIEYLNKYSNLRDYLIEYLINIPITTTQIIKLQSSVLVQLTNATNQLTRKTSIITSTKSYQLSHSLQSKSREISFEDIQIAVQSIIECAANAFSGINAPLQERGIVLDLDFNRANQFPVDYDTDLESIWANPNLFTDGNDFSWETVQKGRNIYYQKQAANSIINQFFQTISLIRSTINLHLNLNQTLIISTTSIYYYLEKILIKSLPNKIIHLSGNGRIKFPSYLNLSRDGDEIVTIQSIMQPLAPYGNNRFNPNTNLSTFISFLLIDKYENIIPISLTIDNPIELIIPRDVNMIIPEMILQNLTYFNRSFYLHFVNLTKDNDLSFSIHFEMNPNNTNLSYLFIYKFDQIPQFNQIDGWTIFCPSNLTNDNLYKYFINNQQTYSHKSIVFGLREFNSSEMENYCLNNINLNSPMVYFNSTSKLTSDYQLRIYTSGCYYLDFNNNWKSDGLFIGSLTNITQTQCYSIYPNRIAAAFSVLPLPIDWNYVFSHVNFTQNRTIYSTILCVFIFYLTLMIYSQIQDKKDLQRIGITILPDNRKSDEYIYEIIVFTGHRKNSGTESKVHFIIHGEKCKTTIRTFIDYNRKILQRNGIDSFLITVPKSLGKLTYIHIWHDNSGEYNSASWFLKSIKIRDLQTMKKYYFICQKWLAVEIDDGIIERFLPVANRIQQEKFENIFSEKIYENVCDHHLWFSIFCRLPLNKFTRIRRCTCCFVLLIITMLFNILYYEQTEQSNVNNGLSIGPLYITLEQIYIGCLIELFSLIPSTFVVQLFRRIKGKKSNENVGLIFPWWCLYFAYSLSLIFVIVSIFFIVVKGIELGDIKVKKWLTSIISGLFSSIFLTQPIQILCITIFHRIFRSKKKNNNEKHFRLIYNEEIQENKSVINPYHNHINRLDKSEIIEARNQYFKEKRMWSIIEEISSYLFFLLILYSITYINSNQNSFLQVKHLQNFFLNPKDSSNNYQKISTINEYWSWLEDSFIENIRAQQWYNGDSPRNLTGFINDKSSRLIGWITMRQLRVKTSLCSLKINNLTCEYDYSLSNEEQNSFKPGWLNQTIKNYSFTILNSFKYQKSDGYKYIGDHGTYSSGGYVYEFRGRLSDIRENISQLHQLKWIDQQTRAILIETSLYNPNIGMFISVNLLIEILSTGGLFPSSRFQPFNIQSFTSFLDLFLILIYVIFILYYLVKEILSLFHLKVSYFYQFWSWLNLSIIICSITSFIIYIYRYKETKRISNLFYETNGYSYINLQYLSSLNDQFNIFLNFSCFFSTIKLINFCRLNRRLCLFNETLKYAWNDMINFFFMFIIIFSGFVILFNQLFSSKNFSSSNLFQTSSMLFQMMLMKFNINEFSEDNQVLGPIYFSLFIIFVVFICMNMFISIIVDSFRIVQKNILIYQNQDFQLLRFLKQKIYKCMGFKQQNQFDDDEEQKDIQRRSHYYNAIEYFPQLIDQLMDVIYQLYLSSEDRRSSRARSLHSIQYDIKEDDSSE